MNMNRMFCAFTKWASFGIASSGGQVTQVDQLGVEMGDEVAQQLLLFDLDLVLTFCLRNPSI